jgi:glutamate racemase
LDNRPIGVFDSGFGGLSVLNALVDVLSEEDFVYIGDTARYPYGPRPRSEVIEYSIQIVDSLINDFDVKLIVVACNTAAAFSMDTILNRVKVPVVGVIEPGVRASLSVSKTKKIGVIGTVGTISSGAYQRTFYNASKEVILKASACPGFVEFVEKGDTNSEELHILASRLLLPVIDAKVDTLLLGCTHYPFIARTISEILGPDVVLVSSADETAFEVERQLKKNSLAGNKKTGSVRYFSSGDVSKFKELGEKLVSGTIEPVEAWSPGR